jgi:D-glycero-alpha-D-manno-heptose 1-phosphate guanylyltransferase
VVTEAIILAGGLGTRLSSVLPDLPKPMAPIAGRPFLSYLIEFLRTCGILRVVLSVGYRNEAICRFFGSSYAGLKLVYSVEEEPLGTGGALLRSLPCIQEQHAFVLNGDTFLRLDYTGMAASLKDNPGAHLAVALRHVADAARYGRAVVARGRIQGFEARGAAGPGLINAGCYLIARDIFDRFPMPPKFSWEKEFLEPRSNEVQPVAFLSDAPFIDIGIPEALQEAQTLIPAWLNTNAKQA